MKKTALVVLSMVLVSLFLIQIAIAAQPVRKTDLCYTYQNGWTICTDRQQINKQDINKNNMNANLKQLDKIYLYNPEGELADRVVMTDTSNYLAKGEGCGYEFHTWHHADGSLTIDFVNGKLIMKEYNAKYLDFVLQFCKGDDFLCQNQCLLHPDTCQ